MATVYPGAIPTVTDLGAAPGANLSTNPHSTKHINEDDTIVAIAAELGVAPSGSFSTVKSRLDTGWQHINAATFTAASTVDITIAASTYQIVRVHLWGVVAVANYIRARVNNDVTVDLHRRFHGHITAASVVNGARALDTSWDIAYWSATGRHGCVLEIFGCHASNQLSYVSHAVSGHAAADADAIGGVWGGQTASAVTISSLRLFPAGGTTMTGNYIAEGYKV